MLPKEILEALGIADEKDALSAITTIKGKVATLQAAIDTAETKRSSGLAETAAITLVDGALKAGKLLPKQTEWAKALCLKDKAAFIAFTVSAPLVGPDMTIKGKDGNDEAVKLTDAEATIADHMGVKQEAIVAFKKEQKKS